MTHKDSKNIMEKIQINDFVVHPEIYYGNEVFRVVGIRTEPDEVELEGDWSGGTHNVCQRGWYKIEGIKIVEKNGKDK